MIPRGQYGRVLATSRNRASERELANTGCEVEEMTEIEATNFSLNVLDAKDQSRMNMMLEN